MKKAFIWLTACVALGVVATAFVFVAKLGPFSYDARFRVQESLLADGRTRKDLVDLQGGTIVFTTLYDRGREAECWRYRNGRVVERQVHSRSGTSYDIYRADGSGKLAYVATVPPLRTFVYNARSAF